MNLSKLLLVLATFLTISVSGQQTKSDPAAGATAAVNAFHAAVQSGNSAAAMKLIAPDALFVEGGGLEGRNQYEENHLPADIDATPAD